MTDNVSKQVRGTMYFGHKDYLIGRHDVTTALRFDTNALMMWLVYVESKDPFSAPKVWLELEDAERLAANLTDWIVGEKARRAQ